jgi:hypothetical protein
VRGQKTSAVVFCAFKMSELFQQIKMMFRDNFASSMFLLVVGTIAFAFIGYLFVDYVRMTVMILRAKRRHRREHHHS